MDTRLIKSSSKVPLGQSYSNRLTGETSTQLTGHRTFYICREEIRNSVTADYGANPQVVGVLNVYGGYFVLTGEAVSDLPFELCTEENVFIYGQTGRMVYAINPGNYSEELNLWPIPLTRPLVTALYHLGVNLPPQAVRLFALPEERVAPVSPLVARAQQFHPPATAAQVLAHAYPAPAYEQLRGASTGSLKAQLEAAQSDELLRDHEMRYSQYTNDFRALLTALEMPPGLRLSDCSPALAGCAIHALEEQYALLLYVRRLVTDWASTGSPRAVELSSRLHPSLINNTFIHHMRKEDVTFNPTMLELLLRLVPVGQLAVDVLADYFEAGENPLLEELSRSLTGLSFQGAAGGLDFTSLLPVTAAIDKLALRHLEVDYHAVGLALLRACEAAKQCSYVFQGVHWQTQVALILERRLEFTSGHQCTAEDVTAMLAVLEVVIVSKRGYDRIMTPVSTAPTAPSVFSVQDGAGGGGETTLLGPHPPRVCITRMPVSGNEPATLGLGLGLGVPTGFNSGVLNRNSGFLANERAFKYRHRQDRQTDRLVHLHLSALLQPPENLAIPPYTTHLH